MTSAVFDMPISNNPPDLQSENPYAPNAECYADLNQEVAVIRHIALRSSRKADFGDRYF